MANIPVEPKANRPWWLWLALGLGLLLLLLLLTRGCDNEDGTVDDPDDAAEVDDLDAADDDLDATDDGLDATDGTLAAGALTSFDDLFAADGASVAGRRVDIDRARVVAVPGDSVFVVAPEGDDSRQVVVVLEDVGESETGAGGADGRYNVDEGDVVDLVGTAEGYREGMPGFSSLDAGRRQELTDRGVYVRARRLDIRESAAPAQ